MINIGQALLNIAPGAQWTIRGNTYADLEWHDEVIPKPTEEEFNTAVANLPSEANIQQENKAIRQSALAKLTALGLTEDEVKALVG